MNKLSDLGSVLNGAPVPTSKGIYPAYGGNGILKFVNCYNYPENTIIIGRVGANCGSVNISDNKCWISDNSLAFIVNKNNDPYYVYYLLKQLDLNKFHIGSSQPLITQTIINNIEYKYKKDKSTQAKLVEILKHIDDKIDKNNQINSKLENLVKTIYDYWFLQFEFPDENGKPYKSSGGEMVWNDELKKEIPSGWEIKSLFQCSDVLYGYPLSTSSFSENGSVEVIRIRDILNNTTSAKTIEKIDEKYLSKSKDLLIGMDGNFCMNFWSRDGDCINQRILRIRDNNSKVSPFQIYFEIMPFIKSKELNNARSTVGHLSDKDIKEIRILQSNNKEIYGYFDSILTKICKNKSENEELRKIRDFLLPLLINGQIGFKD